VVGLRSHGGALANLGYRVSNQTVGNVLKRHGIAPAPQRQHATRWRDFIRAHMEVLAGTDVSSLLFRCRKLHCFASSLSRMMDSDQFCDTTWHLPVR
jgi:hypothetical protein